MLFNSLEYVLFLFIVFVLFWGLMASSGWWGATVTKVLRTLLLLFASWLFYMSWNATFIFLIIGSTVLDYFVGLGLARYERHGVRKLLVTCSVLGNLGALGLFKYADFFIGAASDALTASGLEVSPEPLNLVLPVGISFYTFQTLSYTIDVYRGKLEPTRDFLEFATFVAFFPQLVAGPIVRAREFLPQFDREPELDVKRASDAAFLILRGMIKKILIADFLAANFIDRVFDDPGAYSSAEAWLAVFAYTWQLYGDFSGYTDIARGSAKLFGFELPINFRRPFNSTGPIDFWDRWHITLSTWIRDYVYIPLGGSRQGRARSYANLFVAFVLTGIWHGAGWTFVIFGVWHATTVSINRMYRDWRGTDRPKAEGARRWALVLLNLFLFVFHWPMFRSPNVDNMFAMYGRMFAGDWEAFRVTPWVLACLVAVTVVHYTPSRWVDEAREGMARLPLPLQAGIVVALTAVLVWVGKQQAAPFIYFQF